MPEKRWKYAERQIARLLNCKRFPNDGSSKADYGNEWLLGQNKDRKELPEWLLNAVLQVKAVNDGQHLPVVTLTSAQSQMHLVVIDLADFRDYFVGTPKVRRER